MALSTTAITVGSDLAEQAGSVEYYDANSNSWIKLMELDIDSKIYFKSTMFQGKLVLVSGRRRGDYTSSVESYDFATGTLSTMPPVKQPRYLHAIAVLSNNLYVMGGYNGGFLDSVERFDSSTNQWTDLQPIPTARSYCTATEHDGEIYVIGGFDGENNLSTVESFNPSTGSWRQRNSMNVGRQEPGVASVGSFIYAFGGGSPNPLTVCERYDPSIEQWIYIQDMHINRSMFGNCALSDSMVIAAGGLDASIGKVASAETFNASTGQWTVIASLSSPRTVFNLVEVPLEIINQFSALKNKI